MSELWSQQTELHGIKKIALAGTVSADHGICPWRKGLDLALLSERPEIRQRDLLDVHGLVLLMTTTTWEPCQSRERERPQLPYLTWPEATNNGKQ
jgi:hypothetical protein